MIDIADLVKDYAGDDGPVRVLNGVSVDIKAGEVTVFLGGTGSGKSTLLRCINGLEEFQQGRVRVGGLELGPGRSPGPLLRALRQRVGMVFQRPNPFPKSIFDNVAYGPALNALVARRDLPDLVEKCLRRAALWDEVKDRLDSPGTGLSGGQQQRLCIARALGNSPDVLLMDEPCSALDPIATLKIEELIYSLKEKYTIVIVTHNLQQAARVSDRTAFFWLGRLVEYGLTPDMFTKPREKLTEDYITGRFG